MATQTLTTFDALLKNVYRGPIVELINQETYILDQIEKTNVNNLGQFTGRQLVFPVHTGRNRGRGATSDGGTLATAGAQTYLDGIVALRYFNQAIELTDMVIHQSKTDEGAFVRALESEMTGATTDIRKDVSRMAYGTGDGVLANCTATQSSVNTFSVDSGQYIAVGDTIDVLTKSNGTAKTSAGGQLVTAVTFTGTKDGATQANANITVGGGTISVTASDSVYLTGNRNIESDGLQNIISTGRTLHSINSTTYPVWDANVLAAGQVNANEDQFMRLVQTIRQRSGKTPDVFLTSLGVQRRLANTYTSQKRYDQAKLLDLEGGYSAIMIAAGAKPIPVVADVDAPIGVAFAIDKSSFAWAENKPADWLEAPDGNGQVLHLKDGTTAGTKVAAWNAWITWYAALACVAPNRNGKITGLNDDIPVQRL